MMNRCRLSKISSFCSILSLLNCSPNARFDLKSRDHFLSSNAKDLRLLELFFEDSLLDFRKQLTILSMEIHQLLLNFVSESSLY